MRREKVICFFCQRSRFARFGLRLHFAAKLFPDLRRCHRVVAGIAQILERGHIRPLFHFAIETKHRSHQSDLRQQPARDKTCPSHCIRLCLDIAERLQAVLHFEMREFVGQNGSQLRLVARPQQQAAPYQHHAIGGHRRVELRRPDQINTRTAAFFSTHRAAQNTFDIGIEFRILDEKFGGAHLLLHLIHFEPKPLFERVFGLITGMRRQQLQRLGGKRSCAQSNRCGHKDRIQPAFHCAPTSPEAGEGRPLSSCPIRWLAPSAVRTSPDALKSTPSHTMSPLRKSTSAA